MFERTKILLLSALLVCGVASWGLDGISPYYYDILIGIGINIILATSLNLVNGYTGQFSLGHAGFMAVGAYLGSALSLGIKFPSLPMPEWSAPSLWWILNAISFLFAVLMNAIGGVHNIFVSIAHTLPSWGLFLRRADLWRTDRGPGRV